MSYWLWHSSHQIFFRLAKEWCLICHCPLFSPTLMKTTATRTDLEKKMFLINPESCFNWTSGKPPHLCLAPILRKAAHPAGRAGSRGSTNSVSVGAWPFCMRQRELNWQPLLFNTHCLCILLKSFLCSPWPQFHCHFCPKCPLYSLPISLQLSLEETLAAGDFPATFTCWGLLLI